MIEVLVITIMMGIGAVGGYQMYLDYKDSCNH